MCTCVALERGVVIMERTFYEMVGKNISDMIVRKAITQQSLADILGVSRQVMGKIIKGQKAINVSEIDMISKTLGVSVESLLDVTSQTPDLSPQFSFMGELRSEKTKGKVDLLRNVIDEILFLEEYANGYQQ